MVLKIQKYNIRKNIAPIIISLVLGIAFWFYAKTDATVTNRIKYPVRIKTSKNLILTNSSSDSITLEVTGKVRLQSMLQSIIPKIRIPNKQPGLITIQLEKKVFIFPAYLRIKDFKIVSPDSIRIQLDSLIFKDVRIILSKGLSSNPEKVTIRGPKSFIKDINYLSPDSIPSGNITTITIENKLIRVIPNRIRITR